ncbi:unnamed protein product, partial [Penicillium discolor]
MIAVHHGRSGAGGGIHDDEVQLRRQGRGGDERGGLVQHESPVHALIGEPGERGLHAVRGRDDGERVSTIRRRFGRGLQHPGVADRGQSGHDEAEGMAAPGAQGPRRPVRSVAELGHGGFDPRPGLRVDPGAAVDDAGDRLSGDAGARRDGRHGHARGRRGLLGHGNLRSQVRRVD